MKQHAYTKTNSYDIVQNNNAGISRRQCLSPRPADAQCELCEEYLLPRIQLMISSSITLQTMKGFLTLHVQNVHNSYYHTQNNHNA